MTDDAIQVGDKVVVLQVPGVFRVTGRNGRLVMIESPSGVRLTMRAEGVRRLDGAPAVPKDA